MSPPSNAIVIGNSHLTVFILFIWLHSSISSHKSNSIFIFNEFELHMITIWNVCSGTGNSIPIDDINLFMIMLNALSWYRMSTVCPHINIAISWMLMILKYQSICKYDSDWHRMLSNQRLHVNIVCCRWTNEQINRTNLGSIPNHTHRTHTKLVTKRHQSVAAYSIPHWLMHKSRMRTRINVVHPMLAAHTIAHTLFIEYLLEHYDMDTVFNMNVYTLLCQTSE